MDDSELEARLRMLPPGSKVMLRWITDGDVVHSSGLVGSNSHPVGCRQIETADRDLLVTPTADGVSVSKITETGTEPLGAVTFIRPLKQPTETLRITDAGIDVPPALVGYTGTLDLESHTKHGYVRLSEPGLQRYSRRLLAEIHELYPTFVHERSLWIRPSSGPKLEYELIDDRSHTESSESTRNQQRYGDLQRVTTTVQALSAAIFADDRLADRPSDRIGRKLHALQSKLLAARELLLEPSPRELSVTVNTAARYSWEDYLDALEWIETQIGAIRQRIEADDDLPCERTVSARAHLSRLTELEAIRHTLAESPGGLAVSTTDGVHARTGTDTDTDRHRDRSMIDDTPRHRNKISGERTDRDARAGNTVPVHATTNDADGGVHDE